MEPLEKDEKRSSLDRNASNVYRKRYNYADDSDDEDLDVLESGVVVKPSGHFGYPRYIAGALVNHFYTQRFILFCILTNTIFMGISSTDLPTNSPSATTFLDVSDKVFLVIFTIESGLQLFYHSYKLFFSAWLSFDLLIVILSWAMQNLQVIRGFRILRALRVIMRVGPIKDLIDALTGVIPRLSAIICLMLLILYIFAVLFTQLFKDHDLGDDYFTRLDYTLFTLIQIMTMDFGDLMRETMKYSSYAWFPFVLYILIVGFILFNLIAAVVCDAIGLLKEKEVKGNMIDNTVSEADDRKRLYLLRYQVNILLKCQEEIQETIQLMTEQMVGADTLPPIEETSAFEFEDRTRTGSESVDFSNSSTSTFSNDFISSIEDTK